MELNRADPTGAESNGSTDDIASDKATPSPGDATGSRLLADGGELTTEEPVYPDDDQFSEAETAILVAAVADPTRSNADIASETGYRLPLVRDTRRKYEAVVQRPAETDDRGEADTDPSDTTARAEDQTGREITDDRSPSGESEPTPDGDTQQPNEAAAETAETVSADADADEEKVAESQSVAGSDTDRELINSTNGRRETVEQASPGTSGGGQHEARIQRLELAVSKFEAYTTALEAFIEANGTGSDIIESIREDVETLGETTAAHGEEIDSLGDATASNDSRIAEVSSAVDAIADSLGELSDGVDDRFAHAGDHRDALADQLDSHAADLSELSSAIETLENDVARLEQRSHSDSDLGGRLDSIEGDLETLMRWREQLQTNLMGGDEGGAGTR